MINHVENNAISCSNLSKDFYIIDQYLNWRIVFRDNYLNLESFHALSNVNLNVPKGKFVGILGRNGAGKSTLLRVLAGVYSPTKGIVNVSGEISSLFEMGGLGNNRLTGYGYASRYLQLYGLAKVNRREVIKKIQDFSELGDDFNRPIYTYSSGMKARLYFSTATELQHAIYLVDELLSVGDEHFQAKCWKRLRERFSNGASGILVTHDWSAVLKLCEHSYILEHGRVIAGGSSESIVQKYLQLPIPTKEYAEIITNNQGYCFDSGQDCNIQFNILLKKEISLSVNYSIEIFRPGLGWELVLLNQDFVNIVCKLGLNYCHINIKQLPLAAGEYYLNLFLKSQGDSIELIKLDTRSWTYANGIKFKVNGINANAITVLPWKKRIWSLNDTTHN